MNALASSKLFWPVRLGAVQLKHRVVMAPLTRLRSTQPGDVPNEMMAEYYEQRASDGGLIISEATPVAITGRGYLGAPGIYSDEQVEGWTKVTDAVHAKGGRIILQLWHVSLQSRRQPFLTTASHTRRTVGFRFRQLALSSLMRSRRSSSSFAEAQSARRPLVLMVSRSTEPTVICSISFCRTAATNEPTPTAARLPTALAC